MLISNHHHAAAVTLVISFAFLLLNTASARAEMVMLSPTEDTYIDSRSPTANNSSDSFVISRFNIESGQRTQPFFKFDLSLIPAGSSISDATLKLYLKDMTGKSPVSVEVFRATGDWTEQTLIWNNRPTGPGLGIQASISDNKGNKNFDVAEFVAGWLAGTFPNYGLFIDHPGSSTYSAIFNSSGSEKNQPYLVVYYTPPASGTGAPRVGLSMAQGKGPAITAINITEVTETTVTISWTTDMKADSVIKFGPSAAYDYMIGTNKDVTAHSIILRGLEPGSIYHYRIFSESAAGMTSTSADKTFKTSGITGIDEGLQSTALGWLRLLGLAVGLLTMFLLAVVVFVELQGWWNRRRTRVDST